MRRSRNQNATKRSFDRLVRAWLVEGFCQCSNGWIQVFFWPSPQSRGHAKIGGVLTNAGARDVALSQSLEKVQGKNVCAHDTESGIRDANRLVVQKWTISGVRYGSQYCNGAINRCSTMRPDCWGSCWRAAITDLYTLHFTDHSLRRSISSRGD